MTAIEILEWFGFEQGTASKSDIRKVWFSIPEYGLPPGEVRHRFRSIGCEV